MARILFAPLFIAHLGNRIGGKQIPFPPLFLRQVRFIAVNGATGSIYKLLHTVLPGCLHHVQSSLDIVGAIEQRHLNRARNTAPGRFVQHIVHALAGLHTGVQILDVPFDKLIVRIVEE